MNQRIREVKDGGKLIVLSDGSKWQVSSFDAFHTMMWMPFDEIEVGVAHLINVSRRSQRVSAQRILR